MNKIQMETNTTSKILKEWAYLFSTVEPNKTAKRVLGRINDLQWWCVYSQSGNRYGLAFDVSTKVGKQQFRNYRFLNIEVFPEGNQSLLTIFLKGDDYKSEFALLGSHLMHVVSSFVTDSERIRMVINELGRWETLFSKFQNESLSISRQRGLLGELFLIDILLQTCHFPMTSVIGFWEGFNAAARDFQGNDWAIEVKTSAKSRPRIVHINGERQLDNSLFHSLFLFYFLVDASSNHGITLNEIIRKIREHLITDILASEMFNAKLLMSGYRDQDAEIYSTHYVVRDNVFYHIDECFPKIVEYQLPDGISKLEYNLDLDVCTSWLYPFNKVLEAIQE